MHASLDKTNTGELSLTALQHYIAQADVVEETPQGPVVLDQEMPRWFVYAVLFSAAALILLVLSYYVWSMTHGR